MPFIAGQVGIRPDGTVPDSAEERIRLAFTRLGAILKHQGLGFEDLVELRWQRRGTQTRALRDHARITSHYC